MPLRKPPDKPSGPEPVFTAQRSDGEVFLDRSVDSPFGSTELDQFLQSFPANGYFPSRQEVERLVKNQVNTIFGAFERVRYILERHEDTIRKRWTKKSTKKKKKLLLAAQPGIASEHRPDITMAKNTEACMVPYLNTEDLVQPGTFLTLLSSRGYNSIESFSHTELLHSPIARWSDATLQPYLQTYTMAFAGQHTRTTYGRVKRWGNKEEAWQSVYKGRSVHPGHGLQILGIQKILYTFLERCCFLLIGDLLSGEKAPLEEYPVTQEPRPLFNTSTNYTSRAEVSLMAPYGIPGRLDFDRLRSLVSSKVGELEDHIWALREDPGYFREVFDEYKAHRYEYITSKDGNVNAILKEPPHVMIGAILRNLITDPYLALFYWHECLRLVELLQSTALKLNIRPSFDQDLPPDYHMNFLRPWKMLLALHTDTHECFRQRLPAAQGMRPYLTKTNADSNSGACFFQTNLAHANGNPAVTRFLEVLFRVWRPRSPPKVGFVAELDDIERMAIKEPAVKSLLSSYVWSDFSQMSVSSECIQQIRSYQPWATRMEHDMDLLEPILMDEFLQLGIKWAPVMLMKRFNSVILARLADPSDGKFYYLITEKPTRKTTNASRLAEENLDSFWTAADAYCKKLAGKCFPDLLAHDITRGRSLRRTTPWFDVAPERHEEIHPQHVYRPLLSDTSREVDTTSDEHIKPLTLTKEKSKTRGTANLGRTEADDYLANVHPAEAGEQSLDSSPSRVVVDKRSYLVFKALFFSPSARDVPSEVSWNDFVHAMVQRGFEAEKLHGSSWRFRPKTLGAERAIQFHAPHGTMTKLPLNWARRYGGRLERAYGWTGETFTPA